MAFSDRSGAVLRAGAEQRCGALTGRAVDLRVEADGDLHISLQDATGDAPRMRVTGADRHGVDLVFELPRLVPAESIRRQDRSPKRKTAEKHRNKTVAFHLRGRVALPSHTRE